MRRLFNLVSFCAFVAGTWGTKKPEGDRFASLHAKSLTLAPIQLADATYQDFTAAPRDYAAAVLLTASETRYGCQLCREFATEWELLSRSWINGDKTGASRLVFGTLDFSEGRNTFMSLGLQTAPVLFLFLPTTGPHASASSAAIRYDFTSGPQKAEQVHNWLSRHLPDRPHPPVIRALNWIVWISGITIILGGATGAYVLWPYLVPIVQNRKLWAAGSLLAILMFTSGHMFNHIRKVPYVAGDGRGGISYFAAGFQSQFGMESQIVAAMYGLLSLVAILLVVKVPRMRNPKTQWVAVAACGGTMWFMYSFLLSIFRVKNGGYPYYLPPFM